LLIPNAKILKKKGMEMAVTSVASESQSFTMHSKATKEKLPELEEGKTSDNAELLHYQNKNF
jgi:hypothetical protein